jgi:hypothetical protein
MAKPQAATAEAISKIDAVMKGYEESGLTRRQYCQRAGIPLTTLDYYQRRRRQLRNRHGSGQKTAAGARPSPRPQRLLRVEIEKSRPAAPAKTKKPEHPGFVLTLARGRKIESDWGYCAQDLVQLIRLVEAA